MAAEDGMSAPSIAARRRKPAPGAWLSARLAAVDRRLEAFCDAERDQLPLWLPVGLGLGIAAWFALPGATGWIAFVASSAGAALGVAALGAGRLWGKAGAIFCLAALIGCALIWLRSEAKGAEPLPYPRMAAFEAEVESVRALPARGAIRLILRPGADAGLPERVRVNLDAARGDPALRPGARVRLRAWLMPPGRMPVPGGYDFARVAWFDGLGATGRAVGGIEIVAPSSGQGLWDRIAGARQALGAHIRDRLDEGTSGVAVALATGDQAGISEEDAEAMRRSGLAHLLSISGLHVTAMVGAAMLLALKLLALSPALALRVPLTLVAAGFAALVGIGYTLLAGAEFPTVRACVAALLVLAAIALGREALTLRLVAVGALVVLLAWPEALANPSFQLSFAAVTAIIALLEHPRVKALLARRDEGVAARVWRVALGLFLTGIVVEAALTPIGLFHFHRTGLYGAIANIIAIPFTTFVTMPLETAALLLDLVGLGAPLWWLTDLSLQFLLWLAHYFGYLPGAVGRLPTMPRGAFALMVTGCLWLALWRGRIRSAGLVPVALGALWALATPAPDILVTGDGRHVAVRTENSEMALLRGRAGDYVRNMLSETAGFGAELGRLDDLRGAACSADLCRAEIVRNGRRLVLLATRTDYFVEIGAFTRACAEADIVISDRRLPRTCRPRWLKADRPFLERSGGLAIRLGPPVRVESVSDRVGRHPWTVAARRGE